MNYSKRVSILSYHCIASVEFDSLDGIEGRSLVEQNQTYISRSWTTYFDAATTATPALVPLIPTISSSRPQALQCIHGCPCMMQGKLPDTRLDMRSWGHLTRQGIPKARLIVPAPLRDRPCLGGDASGYPEAWTPPSSSGKCQSPDSIESQIGSNSSFGESEHLYDLGCVECSLIRSRWRPVADADRQLVQEGAYMLSKPHTPSDTNMY